jgi:hypothetical protein
MNFICQILFRLGFVSIFLAILSLILPFIGMQLKNGFLEAPMEKLYAVLVGVALIALAMIINAMSKNK